MTRLSVAAALAFGLLAVALRAAPATASSRVSVVSVHTNNYAGEIVYRLHVGSVAGTTIVIVPVDARVARLEVNGRLRERVGLAVPIGSAPLGHAGPTLTLARERPVDRVEIRIRGSSGKLRFVDGDVIKLTHAVGFASGAYYAVLISLAIVQLVVLCTLPDSTIAWYLGFTLSLIGLELARDDLLPNGMSEPAHDIFRAGFMLCMLGFSVSFLQLRKQSPRLYAAALLLILVPIAIPPFLSAATHLPVPSPVLTALDAFSMSSLIVIAGIRRSNGYVPGTYLGFSLLGLVLVFATQFAFLLLGIRSPFLNYWGLEIGSTFDVVAFSLAIVLQSRYFALEHEQVRSDLDAATHAATHDQLTGLLNRRGLDAALERISSSASTVLYVDLDGFKTINDTGGHAMGDEALKGSADVMRRAVRNIDVVARVGGDEFVIVLVGMVDSQRIADVMGRITAGVSAMQPLGPGTRERLGVSIGSSQVPVGTTFSDALARADADAYRVKTEHRERRLSPRT